MIAIVWCSAARAATVPVPPGAEPSGPLTLTVVLTATSTDPTEVERTIELPANMVATAMSLTMAGGHGGSALRSLDGARTMYWWRVTRTRDPALLEYLDDEHARLRVFPVRRDSPAIVTIELAPKAWARENMVPYLGAWASLYAEPGLAPAAQPEDLAAALTRPGAP